MANDCLAPCIAWSSAASISEVYMGPCLPWWMISITWAISWLRNYRECRYTLMFPAQIMMTSSNGNIFRVTGHLCGEFTDHQRIPRTKARDTELWCFFFDLRLNKQLSNRSWVWWFETPSRPLKRHCNVNSKNSLYFNDMHNLAFYSNNMRLNSKQSLIAKFMGPIWGPSGADRFQVGPLLAPWTLLSGVG